MASPLVSRSAAGLRSPRSTPARIASEGVTVHYFGPSPWGSVDRRSASAFARSASHNRCATIWRSAQAYHMNSNGWTDVAYNSAVCPHGVRFEGRGPGRRSAANGTNAGNARSCAVVYIAGVGDPLTDAAKIALTEEGRRLGGGLRWVHLDWKSTACPGRAVMDWRRIGWRHPGGDVSAPPTPRPPAVSPPPMIRSGSRGTAVRWWQALLNLVAKRGLVEDGIFGPATDKATRDFQRMFRLGVDGIVGPKTWGLMLYFRSLRR